MSSRKWTENQKNAISAREGSILVSAAAGSGKTAVLVERVIEIITDEKNPCDADRLLIVTFTNAAAAEMKERIAEKILKLIENDPYNTRLRRQQILLSKAHISTIHSFCNELIRQNFFKLGISPEFRIADTNEINVLKNDAVQNTLEDLYRDGNKDFFNLVETFGNNKDDRSLINIIYELYDFTRSHPFPEKWMDEKLAMYSAETSISKTSWGKVILSYASDAIEYCISLTNNSLGIMSEDEKIFSAYNSAFSSDLAALTDIKKTIENRHARKVMGEQIFEQSFFKNDENKCSDALCLSKKDEKIMQKIAKKPLQTGFQKIDNDNWDEIYSKIRLFKQERLGSLKGYREDPLKAKITSNRKIVTQTLKQLKKLFISNKEECLNDLNLIKPIINQLFLTVKMFTKELDRLKIERKIADFNDLEHWTLRLLIDPTQDGFIKTDEAIEISRLFEEVIVDEYQDTNEVQDMIFRAVSQNGGNLFVVGDVKQSIYRFRQAMPEIFIRRKESYDIYNSIKNAYPAKIILDKNFRSRSGIISSVNFVFKQLMSEKIGDMEYTAEEQLVVGADYKKRSSPDVSIHIIDVSDCGENSEIIEADHIAKTISEMINSGHKIKDGDNERPVTYRDFCILLRSANKKAPIYAKELECCGIPVWSDVHESFFNKTEISIMLSMLRIIDNPIQDIPLLSVLMSPIYGFTPDDLAEIRVLDRKVPFYFALKKMAEKGNQACLDFLADIEQYRNLAYTVPTDRLINVIFEKSGYPSIVQLMKDGRLRLANLRLLLEYARNFEMSGYKGLSSFIRYINRLQEQGSDLTPASNISETANAVRIMSIHRSKGLEFPICIIADCSKKFNKERKTILLNTDLGIGLKLKHENMINQFSTLPREAISLETEREGISEELRVLYVAMTRAKENLIMINSLKNTAATLAALASQLTDDRSISPHTVRNSSGFSDWILMCAIRHPCGKKLRDISGALPGIIVNEGENWDIKIFYPTNNNDFETEQNLEAETQDCFDPIVLEQISSRFNFKYPSKQLKGIPAKISVSELVSNDKGDKYNLMSRPAFMTNKGLTPAERGTALHKFIQFADLKKAKENPRNQLDYLTENGYLTPDQANAVNIGSIEKFLSSNLAKRMLKSSNILVEYKFTVNIKAKQINENLPNPYANENIVLQGAIDCAFEENGKFIIIDYKTDASRGFDELKRIYIKQLELYKFAIEECTGKKVSQCFIYSFSMDDYISVL